MTRSLSPDRCRPGIRRSTVTIAAGTTLVMVALGGLVAASAAWAAQPKVGLGKATSFVVLAGTTVTNTGATVLSGNLGVSPGSAVTGFPPGHINNGGRHTADALAQQAQKDLTTAYNDAAGRTPGTVVSGDLGGRTLSPGVYKAASALGLTGTLTLDAHGSAGAVFIFQAGSTLITASSSKVRLAGGAQACNVFWQVGSSATLGTHSVFVGSILALTSASVTTGTTVTGRVLARNGQVSLDGNTITLPVCRSSRGTSTSGAGGQVIPSGAPGTGGGGASHSRDAGLIALGVLAMGLAGASLIPIVGRRRG